MSFEDKDEWVSIEVDRFVCKGKKSVRVEIGGDAHWVGDSQIDNLEDILKHLARPTSESEKVTEIVVPKWLAVDNGWEDDD